MVKEKAIKPNHKYYIKYSDNNLIAQTLNDTEYDDDDLRSSYNDEMVHLVFLPGSTGQAWYAQQKCKVCERFHKRVTILIKKDGVST